MRQPESTLREMRAEDVPRVAQIHLQSLPEDFCSRLGLGFLESTFYPHFLQQEGGVGLVSVDAEGAIQGFVIGAAGHGYYEELFRKRIWPLMRATLGSLVKQPSLLAYYVEVARVMLMGGFQPGRRDAELLYIAVDRAARGQSLGSRLTERLIAELSGQSYDRCVVKTLASTPENVQFYRRLGFEILEEKLERVWLAHPLSSEDDR